MTEKIDNFAIPVAPEGFKSGFVAIVGRTNVGKSTLMNQLVGQKIAITSPVSQTTRNLLRGVLTTPEAQMVFVDTPGIHKPHHELGKILVRNAKNAIDSVDLVVWLVDGSVEAGGGDRFILELLQKTTTPVIVGANKCDLESSNNEAIDRTYRELIQDRDYPLVKFSALTGEGTDALQQLAVELLDIGPYYYPPELVTDQPERFIMGELIREQILSLTREEIPHSVAISIERIETTPKLTKIYAAIAIERKSQKGILIGKNGSMLKQIGTEARKNLQKLIENQVYLELFVKVEPQWRSSRFLLEEFGYRVED
jgi:GTPase